VTKVRAFAIPGIELIFYIRDEHPPPHFHAIKTDKWNIRVNFMLCHERHLDFDVKWAVTKQGPSAKERRRLLECVLSHQAELLAEWEQNTPN